MDDDNEVDRTLWCGNLGDEVTEECLYELFLQAGPLEKVKVVTDRETNKPKYAFITFCHTQSVPYTIDLMNGLQLYDKPLRLQTRPGSKHGSQASGTAASRGQPPHSDLSRSVSAPDHIQNFATNAYGQSSHIVQMNQLGPSLTNPMAAQSMLNSANHYPTKEAHRQRMMQQQVAAQVQQQQLMQQQQQHAWLMMQQQIAWNEQQRHWHQ